MQCISDELYQRSSKTEVKESQVFCYRPGESKQTEAGRTEVQRRDRHDEEREREWDREAEEIEERVVPNARA
jgi:hypothetical protein